MTPSVKPPRNDEEDDVGSSNARYTRDDDAENGGARSNDDVIVGPDLNASRSPVDEKLYRQILIKRNGLRVVLVSDTRAQKPTTNGVVVDGGDVEGDRAEVDDEAKGDDFDDEAKGDDFDDEAKGDDFDDDDDDDEEDDYDYDYDDDDDDDEEDDISSSRPSPPFSSAAPTVRKAAAAMAVGVGSFSDPPSCQGLAHFLEHMLFMGTSKYPVENAYDSFLSTRGGHDNAYTELEKTVYHLEIPQEFFSDALDMFSRFFVDPLLSDGAADREVRAIESEFRLSRNSDGCRWQQLVCRTCGRGSAAEHPFAGFSWGNAESLKERPEANDVDVLTELRKFYNAHYYGSNMRLVVMGAGSLDELQDDVVRHFSDVPAAPRPAPPDFPKTFSWDDDHLSERRPYSKLPLPLLPSSLGRVYRVVPVKDRHELSITWQLPSQRRRWRTKPCDLLAHLIGHEGAGSLLARLRRASWATACCAGVGVGGHENASSHALFTLTLTLSEEGVARWVDAVESAYECVGVVRRALASPEGLPPHLVAELEIVHAIAYRHADEPSPADAVEALAEDASDGALPPERLLDGRSLLFGRDEAAARELAETCLTPRNARIDLLSSTFGRGDDPDETGRGRPALTEPSFGTRYWCDEVDEATMERWSAAARGERTNDDLLPLHLPAVNPYVPTEFDLRPLPEEEHDDDEKKDDDDDDDDEEPSPFPGFPVVPPPSPASRLPQLVVDTEQLRLWHLQDRVFRRPVAELRLRLVCPVANSDALHRACADLLVLLCADALTEVRYQASLCELGSSVRSDDEGGLALRLNGFHHKLGELARAALDGLLGLAATQDRFDAVSESLRRRYANHGTRASSASADARLRCLLPWSRSVREKDLALRDLDLDTFHSAVRRIFQRVSVVEALFHGNCDRSDALAVADVVVDALRRHDVSYGAPRPPRGRVVRVPSSDDEVLVPAKDPAEPNTAVEVYLQTDRLDVGVPETRTRALMDVLVQILYEPLFDALRTKEQFGYDVSIGAKYTDGVVGASLRVVSATRTGAEIRDRLERFLVEFRDATLSRMTDDALAEHVVGLARNKMLTYDSLEEQCDELWQTILDGRFEWEYRRNDAASLRRGVTRDDVLRAYDAWFLPGSARRRRLTVTAVGRSRFTDGDGAPLETDDDAGTAFDAAVKRFHDDSGPTYWDEEETKPSPTSEACSNGGTTTT